MFRKKIVKTDSSWLFRLQRIGMCRQQKDQENLHKHNEGTSDEPKPSKHSPKYENKQGEDNSAYYELGDFSQKSQYDKLPWLNCGNPNVAVQYYVCVNNAFLMFGSIWLPKKILNLRRVIEITKFLLCLNKWFLNKNVMGFENQEIGEGQCLSYIILYIQFNLYM